MFTYAPAAGAALIAGFLALALILAPVRSRLRGRRRREEEVVEALSPERRSRLEQF